MNRRLLSKLHRVRVVHLMMGACCWMAAAGCSRSADRPVPVSGRVLVDGKPAVGATVVFHPQGQTTAAKPVGTVDANGEFRLTTAAANDGAAPGDYKVTVAWYVSTPPRKRAAEGDEPPPRNQLPEKFTKPEATPLRVAVSREQTEPVTIEIRRK
jgi:hypothetical protein